MSSTHNSFFKTTAIEFDKVYCPQKESFRVQSQSDKRRSGLNKKLNYGQAIEYSNFNETTKTPKSNLSLRSRHLDKIRRRLPDSYKDELSKVSEALAMQKTKQRHLPA